MLNRTNIPLPDDYYSIIVINPILPCALRRLVALCDWLTLSDIFSLRSHLLFLLRHVGPPCWLSSYVMGTVSDRSIYLAELWPRNRRELLNNNICAACLEDISDEGHTAEKPWQWEDCGMLGCQRLTLYTGWIKCMREEVTVFTAVCLSLGYNYGVDLLLYVC